MCVCLSVSRRSSIIELWIQTSARSRLSQIVVVVDEIKFVVFAMYFNTHMPCFCENRYNFFSLFFCLCTWVSTTLLCFYSSNSQRLSLICFAPVTHSVSKFLVFWNENEIKRKEKNTNQTMSKRDERRFFLQTLLIITRFCPMNFSYNYFVLFAHEAHYYWSFTYILILLLTIFLFHWKKLKCFKEEIEKKNKE